MERSDYLIGIDPGVNTGVAIWDRKKRRLARVGSSTIVEAMTYVGKFSAEIVDLGGTVELWFEDARLRDWFGTSGCERRLGAGSIRRDSGIWEEFCLYHGLKFKKLAPKTSITKLNAKQFARMTGWKGRTNEHSRDAGMLVYGA